MEVKIHKSVFGGKTLDQLSPFDIISIEGYLLSGDFSLDNDDYYYFLFERDIQLDGTKCFDPMEDHHVWTGVVNMGDPCQCGKEVWSINYIGPSGEKPTDFTKGPVS